MANLASIALDMEREARRRGVSYRDLSRGLRLQLNWVDGRKTLRLSRPAVPPSAQEISICRRLFRVPDDAQQTSGDVSVTLRWEAL